MEHAHDYRQIMQKHLAARRVRNPAYSLRAFARDLELSTSLVSDILRGRHGLSLKSATQVAKKLGLSERDSLFFKDSVEANHARSEAQKDRARERLAATAVVDTRTLVREDVLSMMANWYHFGILELVKLTDFTFSAESIAARLQITPFEAEAAIKRLQRMGFIRVTEGQVETLVPDSTTQDDIPSATLRSLHSQLIQRALKAIETQSLQERNITSSVMAISKAQIPEAKALIRKFEDDFSKLMASDPHKDEVYTLAVQFFKLS